MWQTMSQINEFARDLVKRQIQIYNENKSKKFDMTQPLSILICCSIILFSDLKENYKKETLIAEIKMKDYDNKLKNIINEMYNGNVTRRLDSYKNSFLNRELGEYEVFFHDLRNEFAHIIETNKSITLPNYGDFKEITIKTGENTTIITKSQINELINVIYEKLS